MYHERVLVLDYYVDPLSMDETILKVEEIIENTKQCQHVVLNAGKVVMANKDKKLRDIINRCELINADGQSIVWAARILGKHIPERVTGIDLMYRILEMAERKDYGVYFFGAREEVLDKAIIKFKEKYPGLIVAGKRNGYFTNEEVPKIIHDMKNSNAKILMVGISSPTKEYWLNENIGTINIPFCMGVGGSFDIAAGLTKRAPLLFQKIGMEWLFRLMQEPKRMWKRYLVGNITFIIYTIKYRFSIKA